MSEPARQTLQEKYYALNTALSLFLKSKGAACRVVKYGIDPATQKMQAKDQTTVPAARYPYIQTVILNPKPQSWTTYDGGIYTRFEYQLNFFTSPETEVQNDALLFLPFNLARMALSDISLRVFLSVDTVTGNSVTIADLLRIREENSFSMVSGAPVPKAVLLAEMAAVCSYPVVVSGAGLSTNDLGLVPGYSFPP